MPQRLRLTVPSTPTRLRNTMLKAGFVTALMLCAGIANAQSISGKVTDATTGQPLPGARISIGSGAQATVARADGSYQLPATAGTVIIRVSYIGYSPVFDTVVVSGTGATRDYR